MLSKVYSKCQVEKSITDFYVLKYGVQSFCKECAKEDYNKRYAANQLAISERRKKQYKENPEQVQARRDYAKEYYKQNKEKMAASQKKWCENNPDKAAMASARQNKEWRKENNAHYKEVISKWQKHKVLTDVDYKTKVNLRSMLYRTLFGRQKKETTFKLLGYTADDFKERFKVELDYFNCNKIKYDIDHKIPITYFITEVPPNIINHLDNLQPVTREFNRLKLNYFACPVKQEYFLMAIEYVKPEFIEMCTVL